MRKHCVAAICVALGLLLIGRQANALPELKKAFYETYTKKSDDMAFKDAVKKQGCNVCHVKGKKKDERNVYGNALAELIEGSAKERIDKAGDAAAKTKEKAKLVQEIEDAFKKVEEQKVDPEKEDSETFGERLHANKLPVEPSDDSGGDEPEEAEEAEEADSGG
jgi:hypothetical protein